MLLISVHFIFPIMLIIPGYWKIFGIIPFIIGIIFNLVADKDFKKNKTTVKPDEKPNVIITGGIFKFSRNPMYLGMALMQFGIAIFLGSLSPYLFIIIFLALVDRLFIRYEEKMLQEKFGDIWNEYQKSTRKWI